MAKFLDKEVMLVKYKRNGGGPLPDWGRKAYPNLARDTPWKSIRASTFGENSIYSRKIRKAPCPLKSRCITLPLKSMGCKIMAA